jgi:hypothetical protein
MTRPLRENGWRREHHWKTLPCQALKPSLISCACAVAVPATAATNASRVIMDKHFILSLKGWVELSVALFFQINFGNL